MGLGGLADPSPLSVGGLIFLLLGQFCACSKEMRWQWRPGVGIRSFPLRPGSGAASSTGEGQMKVMFRQIWLNLTTSANAIGNSEVMFMKLC